MKTTMNEEDMRELSADGKIAILATVTPEGYPHCTMITSLQAKSANQLIMGEFCRGMSKEQIQTTTKAAFIAISLDKQFRLALVDWDHLEEKGDDYERMNMIPMFRYNTYFGIQKVHFLNLVGMTEKRPLPMAGIVFSAVMTILGKGGMKRSGSRQILSPFGMKMINTLDSLSFLSYINSDGYPEIIPVIQTQAADSGRVVFYPGAFGDAIKTIPEKAICSLFCMNFDMESVLIRGPFNGIRRSRGIPLGSIDIEWVYNSIPPAHGQIYPPVPLKTISEGAGI